MSGVWGWLSLARNFTTEKVDVINKDCILFLSIMSALQKVVFFITRLKPLNNPVCDQG